MALDTDDFDFMPQTITFPRDEDTISVQIMLNDDMMLEEKETFAVTLNVTGNVKDVVVGTRNTVMVTIEDDDGKYNVQMCILMYFICLILLCSCKGPV